MGKGQTRSMPTPPRTPREEAAEQQLSLHQQRHGTVLSMLQARGARRIIDLGCGEGRLVRDLLKHRTLEKIVGMDVAHRSLEIAADRLRLDQLPPLVRQRVELFHGSLMYRDPRLQGFDAAVLCEVIEHMDEPRLAAMERIVFEFARPGIVIITTPNREYNVKWETLPAGSMRHRDHRFEWTRDEFKAWAAGVSVRFGYTAEFRPVGPEDPALGAPTQMGVFTRAG
jgi:3' terminal RNA ribose 2'-O-methyltransferase Hen1